MAAGCPRKELGDYYKDFMRMSAEKAFEAFISISGAPDDRPYKNPFYWTAFTFNGSMTQPLTVGLFYEKGD